MPRAHVTHPRRVRTSNALLTILRDRQPHEFWLILCRGLYSRKTIRLCKNGRLEIKHHIDGHRSWCHPLDFTNDHVYGTAMERGNFVAVPSEAKVK